MRIGCSVAHLAVVEAAIDWDAIYNKTVKAPWVPRLKDPFDATHFDQFDDNDDILPYEHDPSTDVDGQPWHTGFC